MKRLIQGDVARPMILFSFAAAVLLGAAAMARAATFTVTNTSGGGAGSLRQAILDANGAVGLDNIEFDIPGAGPHVIAVSSALPVITDPVAIRGYTQPGSTFNTNAGWQASNAVIMIEINEITGALLNGLDLGPGSDGSRIQNLSITGFLGAGVSISSADNFVRGCLIGLHPDGTSGSNGTGILVSANGNDIGGSNPEDRNVISFNNIDGIHVSGVGVNAVIQGNFIGTNPAGNAASPNVVHAIRVSALGAAAIGGSSTSGAGNLLSGNGGSGVFVLTSASSTIRGNRIGTTVDGNSALPNGTSGVALSAGTSGISLGGPADQGNVISGNVGFGVRLIGGTTNNTVRGNLIGTNAAGTGALANTFGGIEMQNAPSNTIGGAGAGERNVISGNTGAGIVITGSGAPGTRILGNYIGTDASGTADLGNSGIGIDITAPVDTIGGSLPGEGNVISGNGAQGIFIGGSASNTSVLGNYIGTDATGNVDLGNTQNGLQIGSGNNVVGGVGVGEGNVISGNDGAGIALGAGSNGNLIRGNYIGTNASGTAALGNTANGVDIAASVSNTIGGTAVGARNIISGNHSNGIRISGAGATGNVVLGNYIGTDVSGTADLGNLVMGIDVLSPGVTIGGSAPGAGNVISGNDNVGVRVFGATASAQIRGNYVGTNASGTAAIGNTQFGILITAGASGTVGGANPGEGNLVSGNGQHGVILALTTGVPVRGNKIGTDVSGTTALGNGRGVVIETGTSNIVGGSEPGEANVIAFNIFQGVWLFDDGSANAILSNSIHSNGGLGIDLDVTGVTPNDGGDGDGGPNNLQNFPVFTSSTSNSTTVQGLINGPSFGSYRLEFFWNTSCDASGNGEGETFLGFADVVADESGDAPFNATFPMTVPVGDYVTATATDSSGNTSEFSLCSQVTAETVPPPPPGFGHAWSKGVGSTGEDNVWDVTTDSAGNVIAIGVFENTVNFGGGPLNSAGGSDIFVAKFDAAGNHLWSHRYGDTGHDIGWSVVTDGGGNIMVTGQFRGSVSFGNGTLVSPGGDDIFVAKLDPSGNHLWSHSFGDASNQHGYSVDTDAAGSVFMTGEFGGTVNFGGGALTSTGSLDVFIAKFDASGNHLFSNSFGDGSSQSGYDLAVDNENNFVVTGPFQGSADFGDGLLTSAGDADVFVAKFNNAGGPMWSRRYGDSLGQYGYSIAVDALDNVVLTGYFSGGMLVGEDSLTSAGGTDAFLVKLDQFGIPLFVKSFDDANTSSYGYSVAIDAAENVLLTGYFWGTVDFGGGALTSADNYDVFLARFDPSGNHVTSERFGDAAEQYGYGVTSDNMGNVTIAGGYRGTVDFGGGPLPDAGATTDLFVAKLSSAAPAGPPFFDWSKSFGDSDLQYGYGVDIAADSSSVAAGYFQGTVNFGGPTLLSAGGTDIFVVKFDAAGNHIWSRHFGDTDHQQAYRVAVDHVGNVFVAGTFRGTVNFGFPPLTSAGGQDIFVAKLDPAGNHVWSRRFGDVSDDVAYGLVADGLGNAVVTGYFNGTVDFGGGPLTGDNDVFVAKYSSVGNHLWSRRYGDASDQFGQGLTVDSADNVLVTGYFYGSLDFGGGPLVSTGDTDIFVAKLNPGGGHMWSQRFGDTLDQYGYSVAADASNNVYLSGFFAGAAEFGGGALTSAGDYDIFVAKFNPVGSHMWSQRFGDTAQQAGYGMDVNASGDVFLTGYLYGSADFGGGTLTVTGGGNDIFLAKLDPAGTHMWSRAYGDTMPQFGYGIAVGPEGAGVMTGGFQGTVNFGDGPLTSAGNYDIFVANFQAGDVVPLVEPDLEVITFSGPSQATPGNNIGPDISLTIRNSGTTDVTDPFSVGIYYSTDAVLDTTDLFIAAQPLPDLAAQTSVAIPFNQAHLPLATPVGPGFLLARADNADDIAEADESNNTASTAITIDALTTTGEIVVYFDQALTQREADCPGVGPDTLYVVAENLGTPIFAIQYMIDYPAIMTFVEDLDTPTFTTGTSETGIFMNYSSPIDATTQVLLQRVVVNWTCDDCVQLDDPIAVVPFPSSAYITAVASPSSDLIICAGAVSQICADSDIDGVLNGIDQCPTESASFYDVNGDGCVDFAADNRRVEFWTIPDFPVSFVVNQTGAPGIPVMSAVADVQTGLATWNGAGGSLAQYAFGGLTPQLDAQALDGVNLVTFNDPDFNFPPGVLAVGIATSFTAPTFSGGELYRPGQLYDFDMIFNHAIQFSGASGGTGPRILDVAVHEAGHGLGISHSVVQTSSMAYVLTPTAETLTEDDELTVLMQYAPDGVLETGTGIRGTIRDGYTNNPIAGAVVFLVSTGGDTTGCAITRSDGSYVFAGLPGTDYFVGVQPLDGSSAINFIQPGNINPVVGAIPQVLFQAEWWDDAESNMDDGSVRTSNIMDPGQQNTVNIITNVDLTPPVVTTVSPADNTLDVPFGSAILIQFSEPINAGSIQGNLRLQNLTTMAFLGGSAAVLSDETVIAFIPSGVTFSTQFELTVEPGLTDKFNNSIAAPFVSHFTTQAQPSLFISSLTPNQGPVGTIVTIEGGGFESNPGDNSVYVGGQLAVVQSATPLHLTVAVPPGAVSGNIQVVSDVQPDTSNTLPFTVLSPQAVVKVSGAGSASVGAVPRALTLLPDASRAFVATADGFAVVETDATESNFLDATEFPVPGGFDGIDATAVGDRVYAVSTTNLKFYGIDTNPVAVTNEVDVAAGTPLSILVDSGRRRAYVPTDLGEITIWDINEANIATYETQVGVIEAGPNLRGPMAMAQGTYLLALSGTGTLLVFDLGLDTLLHEIPVGLDPRGVTTNPQGDLAYVTDAGGSIDVVSLVSFTNLTTIPTGGSLRQPSVTPDGAFLFAVNRQQNVFNVIDLRGGETFHQIVANPTVGVNPTAGEIGSDGLFAFALSEMDETLDAIAIGLGSVLNSVSPPAGPVGARLVLAGSGFTDSYTTAVSFNGTMVSPDVLEADRIVVTVPANATSGPLSVVGTNLVGPNVMSNVHFFAVLDTTPPVPDRIRIAGSAQPTGAPELTACIAVSQTGDFVVVAGDSIIHFMDSDPASPTLNQFFDQMFVPPVASVDDIVITPDGKRTFVLQQNGAVQVVNSDRFSSGFKSLLGPVDLSSVASPAPTRMAMHPDGRTLLVSDQGKGSLYIVDIEEGSPTQYEIKTTLNFSGAFGTNGHVRNMAFHPTGQYAYLCVIDQAVADLVLVLDLASETIVGSAAFPGGAPFEIPQSLDFTPDGNLCLVYTTQIAGPAARTLHAFDTVTPANPDWVGAYVISTNGPTALEHVRVSPAGDRAVLNIRQVGYLYFDIEDPTALEALELTGDLFHHLALLDFDWARDPSISTDRTHFYSVSGFQNIVYAQDFSGPRDLAILSGDAQMGFVDQTLPQQIRVKATYTGSLVPAPGVPVTFNVTAGGGVFTGTGTATEVAVTGPDGVAGVSWTLGPEVSGDVHMAQAVTFGLAGSPTTFTANAQADPNTLPLAISSVSPPDNSANTSINTSTQVVFTRAVDTNSIGSGTMRILQGATVIPVTYGFSDLNRRVSMTPAAPLSTSTTYTIEVTAGTLDASAGPLSTPLTTTFSTEAPPPLALNSVDPPSALPGSPIIISGTGIDPDAGDNVVTFPPGVTAVVSDAGTDFVSVDVPIGATSGPIQVQVNASTATIPFIVLTPAEESVDEVIANVGTGTPTRTIGITPDGTRAYATGEDVVVTIDIENLTSGDAIPVGADPVAIVISPDGKFAYVANYGSGTVSIIDVDPNSSEFETNVDDLNVGSSPIDLAVHPDGDRLFVVNSGSKTVSIVDTDEFSETFHAVIGNVGTGSNSTPRTVTITPDGTIMYVGTDNSIQILSTLDFGVVGNMGTNNTTTKTVTVTPDGTKLVVLTADGQIVVYDIVSGSPTENQVIGTFGGGGNQQTKSVTVTPDGTQLWAVQEVGDVILVLSLDFTGGISVIDVPATARTLEIVDEVDAGEDPAFVVFDPRGTGTVLVTNPGDRTITVLGRRTMLTAELEITPTEFKVWKITNDDPEGIHLKSNIRYVDARIEVPLPSGTVAFGESEVEDIVLKDLVTDEATGAPAVSGEMDVRDDDGDNIQEIYVKFDRLDFQLEVPSGESVPVQVRGRIRGLEFVAYDTVETLMPGVRTPHAAQIIAAAAPFDVTWQSPAGANADGVDVYWTHGDGTDWYAIANRVADTGKVTWVTPEAHFTECRVMIVLSRDGRTIGGAMSQEVFSIGGPARVALAGVEVVPGRYGARLQWTTSLESGLEGFHVLRSQDQDAGYERITQAPVPARGAEASYDFDDETVKLNRTYYYKLQGVSKEGGGQDFGPYVFRSSARFTLEQNAPNPFNPTTVIRFTLPADGHVRLAIYDVAGRRVRTLVDDRRTADYYEITWDGRDASGNAVASGVYFYRIEAGEHRATKKMVMLK